MLPQHRKIEWNKGVADQKKTLPIRPEADSVNSHPMTIYLVPAIGAETVWETVEGGCLAFYEETK